ncbi:MAG: TadE/TadG family type IV pilus assembly protein [Pirellulales bacterium]
MKRSSINRRIARRSVERRRLGAVLSMELILVLPIMIGLVCALIEFGMLWSSGQRVKEAASAGCRTASFRGADEQAVRTAVERTLGRRNLITTYSLNVEKVRPESNEVAVTVSVPMNAAAPDLLAFLGFGLKEKTVVARTIMRTE